MAGGEGAGDVLGEGLDFAFFAGFDAFVVEAREDVLGVDLIEFLHFGRDFGEEGGDFVLDVEPAGREEVHLDDGVAVGVILAGHEARALGIGVGIAVIVAVGAVEALPFGGRVVGVGLAVGDEAGEDAVSGSATAEEMVRCTGSCGLAMRLSCPWTTCW